MLTKIGTTSHGNVLIECSEQEFNAIGIAAQMILAAVVVAPASQKPEPVVRNPDDQSRVPVRRAARKTNRKAKAARPADGARTCMDCKKPLPAGSAPQRLRCDDCIKIKTRKAANAAYHAKHAKKPAPASAREKPAARPGGTPALPGKPVSDTARKIAALREAREIEQERIASIPH